MSSMTKSTGMPKPVTVALSETDKVKRGSSSIPTLTSKSDVSAPASLEKPIAPVKPKELKPEEKKAQIVAQKKAFDDRFRKRGKRPLPPPQDDTDPASARWKKPKPELTAYELEVQKYESRMLKDTGSGLRSHMK